MACGDRNKIKKLSGIGIRKSKSLLPPGTSLASVESLSVPLVSFFFFFSFSFFFFLSLSLCCLFGFRVDFGSKQVQEIVLSADIRCSQCQKRVADIMSRMSETDSIEVNVLEKKVTLTCRYPIVAKVSTTRQFTETHRNSLNKVAIFRRIFTSS
ncbi:hypothetical protein FEM48_Zijuj10G0146800 [Ziziphus jujuba var. spinosa]|uniref:HMA domain-containing protein n=1 Tax=Ziziphus jujuba var. spinosa TaxID=714518 RepID=A0A978UNZ7_ZIZJJ|nr:hypothetical protein FEM48_Zijuj10G0146800 [Ziziphus jujuba var. spinosa]